MSSIAFGDELPPTSWKIQKSPGGPRPSRRRRRKHARLWVDQFIHVSSGLKATFLVDETQHLERMNQHFEWMNQHFDRFDHGKRQNHHTLQGFCRVSLETKWTKLEPAAVNCRIDHHFLCKEIWCINIYILAVKIGKEGSQICTAHANLRPSHLEAPLKSQW